MTVLNRELAVTAVSHSKEQRQEFQNNLHPLSVVLVNLPAADTADLLPAQKPAFQELVQEARRIIDHPYENRWWEIPMEKFISGNEEQIATEIRARNAGYAGFRSSDGHEE